MGTRPLRHLKIMVTSRKRNSSSMVSQPSPCKTGVMCDKTFFVLVVIHKLTQSAMNLMMFLGVTPDCAIT